MFFDSRKREYPGIWWVLATVLFGPLVVPIYLAKRNLKAGEEREGGLAWNILKNFSLFWTITLVIAFVAGLVSATSDLHPQNDAETTGAGIGMFLAMILYFVLWFIPVAGALTVGFILKKSSIIEKGPTGALNKATITHNIPPGIPSKNITIHRDGQNYGPYSLEEVREHLATGTLVLTDMAFLEGASEWTTLNLVPGIATSSPRPPPPRSLSMPLPPPVQTNATAAGPVAKGTNNVMKYGLGCLGAAVIGVIFLAVIAAIGGKGGHSTVDQSSPTAVDSAIPANQKSFTSIVESFKDPYESADTEIKKTNVRFNRKTAISNYFSQVRSLQFQGWIGEVEHLTTESDGTSYVSVKLAGSNVVIQTNNNSLSDLMGEHTMIQRSDPLYQSLMNIKEGDDVTVSGTFILGTVGLDYVVESSVTEEGSMTEPEFIVKFSQIGSPTTNNASQGASATVNAATQVPTPPTPAQSAVSQAPPAPSAPQSANNQAPPSPNADQTVTNQTLTTPSGTQPATSLAKVGDTIKTQTLEITLTSVAVRGSVGTDFDESKPSEGGMYVAIQWSYKNISNQPIDALSTPTIKLVDNSGVVYSGDVGASGSFASELKIDAKLVSDLNPGIKVTDADVFEISKDSLAKPGWKVKISGDQDVLYQVDLSGTNAESMNNSGNDVLAPQVPTPSITTPTNPAVVANVAPAPSPPPVATPLPVPSPPAGPDASNALASKIVGSWQSSRHVNTYLADGRFGLDVDTTGEYFGRWSIAGNTLTTTYGQDNVPSVYSNVTVTDKELSFDFQGHRFTEQRVGDKSPPGTDTTTINQSVAPSASQGNSNASQADKNFTNSIGMEMVWVAPLKCWVGKYDITQEEYEKLTGENPSSYQGVRRPVDSVSWVEAVAYAKKLTAKEKDRGVLPAGYQYSLPTDAQYDVYVGDATLNDAVTSLDGVRNSTAEVGSKGANSYGLFDTRGNVWQWCQEWFRADMNSSELRSNYSALTDDGGGQKFKVLRGGSWGSDPSDYFLTSFHSYNDPEIRRDRDGFRLVLEPNRQ
jgi:formylglycine-generating enzyme required for sulfatase activity